MSGTNAPSNPGRRSKLWSRAEAVALKAPASRNRYVDFLRAFSIMAVVIGHWLVAAPYIENGVVQGGHLLGIQPWTQWLSWGFQVMPIFFLVGGFSNGVSWAANLRNGGSYVEWFTGRLQRLVNPVLPLFLIWTGIALFGTAAGIDKSIVKLATQLALIPVWFLAVYLLVAAVVPWTFDAFRRFGMASFLALVVAAIIVDALTYAAGVPHLNFINFAFVWLAVHQLGYAWNEGYFASPKHAALWAVAGGIALGALVGFGPYPVAMIGVPGEDVSNSMPPTLALLALGVTQTGLVLALEPIGRRLLENLKAWTAVVLVNGMIMTIYLWHLTAFILVMIVAWLMGGVGLEVVPGSGTWWLARPIWFALYIVTLLPLIAMFAGYERAEGNASTGDVAHWRLIIGLVLVCAGLAATAAISISSPLGVTGVRLWVVALPFIGAAFVGFGPVHRLVHRLR